MRVLIETESNNNNLWLYDLFCLVSTCVSSKKVALRKVKASVHIKMRCQSLHKLDPHFDYTNGSEANSMRMQISQLILSFDAYNTTFDVWLWQHVHVCMYVRVEYC